LGASSSFTEFPSKHQNISNDISSKNYKATQIIKPHDDEDERECAPQSNSMFSLHTKATGGGNL